MTLTLVGTPPRGHLDKIRDEVNYYPHQIEGVRELARRRSFILADDMGLGKSIQALTVAACDFHVGRARRVLVIAPLSLKWNWVQEIETHTLFTCVVLDGNKRARAKQLAAFDADILIVNYEQVVAHLDELNALGFDIAIYDEAHYLKSPTAKRSRACRALRVGRTFLLTGSPILNQVNDLWALLNMIDPASYPSYWSFLHRYGVFGGYKDKQIVSVKNYEELNERVRGVMLRRLKEDVLDLPDKLYIPLVVDLSPEQRKLYKQASEELVLALPDNPDPMELENALTKMLRLKQICGTTACIEGYDDHSSKLDLAVERALEIMQMGEKLVIFTQFRPVLECLVRRLDEHISKSGRLKSMGATDAARYQLHGDVKVEERQSRVNAWANAPGPAALCAMIQVAGVGLNMTAASKAIFLDRVWSPKMNDQAEDRLHRIGQKSQVEIITISCRNTIEQRVETILRRKRKTFDTVIEDDDWKRKLVQSLADEDDLAA